MAGILLNTDLIKSFNIGEMRFLLGVYNEMYTFHKVPFGHINLYLELGQ